MEQKPESIGPKIGGTIIAFFVAVIVILVVSSAVSFLMSMLQFYVGNMREEAALTFGNVAGGIASVYTARAACDATIKIYSSRTLFLLIGTLLIGFAIFELSLGLTIDSLYQFACLISNFITAYIVFWKEDF